MTLALSLSLFPSLPLPFAPVGDLLLLPRPHQPRFPVRSQIQTTVRAGAFGAGIAPVISTSLVRARTKFYSYKWVLVHRLMRG